MDRLIEIVEKTALRVSTEDFEVLYRLHGRMIDMKLRGVKYYE